MASTKNQRGSAHVIVTVILVAGLLAALGVIFWQNFVNKSDDSDTKATSKTKESASKEETKPKLKQASIDATFGTKLSFDYPEDWTLSRTANGPFPPSAEVEPTGESFTVTSPDEEVYARISVNANGGFGFMCDEESAGTVSKLEYESIPGFAGTSMTEYITKQDNQYMFNSYIQSSSGLADVKAGDSACEVSGGSIILLNQAKRLYLMNAGVYVKKIMGENNVTKTFSSIDEIESELKSDTYKQAKDILLSTKVSG